MDSQERDILKERFEITPEGRACSDNGDDAGIGLDPVIDSTAMDTSFDVSAPGILDDSVLSEEDAGTSDERITERHNDVFSRRGDRQEREPQGNREVKLLASFMADLLQRQRIETTHTRSTTGGSPPQSIERTFSLGEHWLETPSSSPVVGKIQDEETTAASERTRFPTPTDTGIVASLHGNETMTFGIIPCGIIGDRDSPEIPVLSTPETTLLLAQDGLLVGTPDILVHSNSVSKAVMGKIERPSVFKDARGSIHNILVGSQKLNLLFTKATMMRSGDIHRVTQFDFVVSGVVCVWTLCTDGTTNKRTYEAQEMIRIPPFTPHVFEFLKDSVILEWWDGPFEAWYYKPYRDIVTRSFPVSLQSLDRDSVEEESNSSPQPILQFRQFSENLLKFQLLNTLKEARTKNCGGLQKLKSTLKERKWWCASILVSLSVGYALSRRPRRMSHSSNSQRRKR